ncbi:MAG: tetratricopeptide repeat protein [Pirellulaceae bacterium]|nr:tetratricopeptide repeat protein [Pirellulaceae bacterium]
MKATILWLSPLLGCVTFLSPNLCAQQGAQFQPRNKRDAPSQPVAQASEQAISQDLLTVYGKTRTASDEASLTAIARACAKVIPDKQRNSADRKYASNLFAWALNRRGELRNEEAANLVEQGQFDQANSLDQQAAKDFETAIQYNDKNWRIHHNLAISLAMKGDYLRGIKEFSTAIDLNADYANSYFNRAELYFELSQFPQALEDYTRAIALSESDPQYYNSRGHCRFMLEAYDDALADYLRASELGADSAAYATDLADAYQFLGRWAEANTTYRQAVAINSKYPRAYQNAAWLMATCPDPKYRNVDLALSAAKKVIELTGERSPQALDTLAAATAASGQHRDAARLQQEAVQLADKNEKGEMAQRLELYQHGQAYLQPSATTAIASQTSNVGSRIRMASGSSRAAR